MALYCRAGNINPMNSNNTYKTIIYCLLLIAALLNAQADSLRFTSGSLTGQIATLSVAGNSNLVCELQRLNPTNDTWTVTSTFTLGSSGTCTLTNGLVAGYGYFRARSTNGSYLSTNAFGAISLTLPHGYSLIGNPFNTQYCTQIFPSPVDGLNLTRLTNGFQWEDAAVYDFGEWNHNDALQRGEGAVVFSPTTNLVAQFWGLFSTNGFSKTIPSGWSILTTPLYHVTDFTLMTVDTLNTNSPAGASSFPISSTSSPQARLERIPNPSSSTFSLYSLTNGVWYINGTNSLPIPIASGESILWRNEATNSATWSINSIPIW
jgi:hypothetical protein